MSYGLSVLMVYISRNVTLRMRRDLFNRLADMPVSFFDTHPIGDIISRIFYDIDTINTSLSTDVVTILASFITIVGSLLMMNVHILAEDLMDTLCLADDIITAVNTGLHMESPIRADNRTQFTQVLGIIDPAFSTQNGRIGGHTSYRKNFQ